MAEMWEARAGRGARCGGRGEGVREGWVWARGVRREGEVRRGVSWEVLGGGVSFAVAGEGGGWGGRYVLLRRTSGSQCSEGSGGWG